jgi:hypothetical protein
MRRWPTMKRKLKRAVVVCLIVVAVAFGLIQLAPVDRGNPPVESDIVASPEVKAILKRSCYDCHSNETVWPWYSSVAPVSWVVARDVHRGREELNFSTWARSASPEQAKKATASWKEVLEGEMPPRSYLTVHPEARLSPEDRAVLRAWAGGSSPAWAER